MMDTRCDRAIKVAMILVNIIWALGKNLFSLLWALDTSWAVKVAMILVNIIWALGYHVSQ